MIDLDHLKRDVDLRVLATSHGFREVKGDKWAGHGHALRRNKGERFYISRQPWGDMFWQPSAGRAGSVIDFLKVFEGKSTREAINELKTWNRQPETFKAAATEIVRDLRSVQRRIEHMRRVSEHPYLNETRGIPKLVTGSWRFAGKVLCDWRGNAVFPHVNEKGICGAEMRGENWKGFMKGGTRGLWLSKSIPEDNRLVICESAIDALSVASLQDDGRTRYASLGGCPSSAQKELLAKEVMRLPHGCIIAAASDNDAGGEKIAEFIKAVCEVALQDGEFVRLAPKGYKDWNELLQVERSSALTRMRSLYGDAGLRA